ncbi:MAG: phosphatase PAP2 family protein [Promethearchaeota archaeon]
MIFFDPNVIIFLQALLPYVAWEILNLFSDPLIYVILLSVAFWCVNKREGKIAIMLVMFSHFINILLKYAFGMPRPPPELRHNPEYAVDQSYGFPSGAVQTATSFWGWATLRLRRWSVVIIGIVLIIITALARMGIGMHYFGDVISGVIVGIILLVWAYFLVPSFIPHWTKFPQYIKDWFFPLLALTFFFCYFTAYAFNLLFFPTENVAISMGVVFGFSLGLIFETRYVNFSTEVSKNTRIFRAILGVLLGLTIYYGLSMAFSLLPMYPLLSYSARFIRYTIVGFVGAFVIPYIFNYLEIRRGVTTS